MLAPERKKLRQLEKSNRRQARFRAKKRANSETCLQVSISLFAHNKAIQLKEKTGGRLVDVYEAAILSANLDSLPPKHDEVLEGDLIGYKQVAPWVPTKTFERFEKMAKHYRSRPIAMSAIVNAYCDSKL